MTQCSLPRPKALTPLLILAVTAILSLLWTASAPGWAAERRPLLMEGKSTLHQRILTRGGADLLAMPDDGAPGVTAGLPPLSIFFVYGRKNVAGQEWLEIGRASRGEPDGWIKAEQAIDWKQTLTVAFSKRIGRDPALFFRERRDVVDLIKSADAARAVDRFHGEIQSGALQPNSPVVSVEPDTPVDIDTKPYLLPILDHSETSFKKGFTAQVLQVAAESLRQDDAPAVIPAVTPRRVPAEAAAPYQAGVVFVVDTTTSMNPYIDRTREVIQRVYQKLAGSSSGPNMAFGLIGFRDNISVRPKLEYVTHTFSDLRSVRDAAEFMGRVRDARAATVSSQGFDEDAYAGVLKAIQGITWSGYDARFVVVITDAGARRGNDPLGATGLDAEQLNILARENNIALCVLHLLTPEGKKAGDHEPARRQYEELSAFPAAGSLYLGVESGDVAEFGRRIDSFSDMLLGQVMSIGQVAGAAEPPTLKAEPPPAASPSGQDGGKAAEFERRVELAGRAMQLAYLGRVAGSEAPRLFQAWVADRDLVNPKQKSLEVRVLITKDQLSDLEQTLRSILRAGEETRLKPTDFFGHLRSAAATLSRSPESVNENTVKRLADLGLIGEYLENLPYYSKLMELTEDDWLSWGYGQQREFLDGLESKLTSYREYHDQTHLWLALDEGRIKGDAVYQIPLDALP
jgi:serine/threonine-protein kinase PpkA